MTPVIAVYPIWIKNLDMQAAMTTPAVRLKPIAIPSEHGGWGMLGAPILTGLLLAPSWAGIAIAVAALAAFLTRQPFRLALSDIRKGKRYPRTAWALRFAAGYAALGLMALALAISLAKTSFWIPMLLCATLGAIQFSFDIKGKGHSFVPEVCGASAMAVIATAILQSAGFAPTRSWLPALLLALQAATAISYASARVRLARGVNVERWPIWAAHLGALGVVAGIASTGAVRWPIALVFAVLAARAGWGLSPYRLQIKAAFVGMEEVGYAVLTVACIVLSMR